MSVSPASTFESEPVALRARRLAAARRRATALLGGVTVLFVVVTAVGVHGTFLGYLQAGAEASMVGGVADWFAVTALFRHPLGLPIPHTALIVERKDQFLDDGFLRECWDAHQSGIRDWSALLWCVLMFRAWEDASVRS